MPDDYASAPVAKLDFKMTAAVSGNVQWDVRVAAVTSGDALSVNGKVFGAANTATVVVPTTAGYMTEGAVTVTNADSLAAGDFVVLRVCRVGSDAADTATGDAELVQVTLAYTTV
jgi:hypothetical protein